MTPPGPSQVRWASSVTVGVGPGGLEEVAEPLVLAEHRLHPCAEVVVGTGFPEERGPRGGIGLMQGGDEDVSLGHDEALGP